MWLVNLDRASPFQEALVKRRGLFPSTFGPWWSGARSRSPQERMQRHRRLHKMMPRKPKSLTLVWYFDFKSRRLSIHTSSNGTGYPEVQLYKTTLPRAWPPSSQKRTIFSISSAVDMPVEMCTSPQYSSRRTFIISQWRFDGDPTLIKSGFKETISRAEVTSQTEQEYPKPIESQCAFSSRCCSRLNSKNYGAIRKFRHMNA